MNEPVLVLCRVDLADDVGFQFFVGADRAERLAFKGGRGGGADDDQTTRACTGVAPSMAQATAFIGSSILGFPGRSDYAVVTETRLSGV